MDKILAILVSLITVTPVPAVEYMSSTIVLIATIPLTAPNSMYYKSLYSDYLDAVDVEGGGISNNIDESSLSDVIDYFNLVQSNSTRYEDVLNITYDASDYDSATINVKVETI